MSMVMPDRYRQTGAVRRARVGLQVIGMTFQAPRTFSGALYSRSPKCPRSQMYGAPAEL